MKSGKGTGLTLGSEDFWALYDRFCLEGSLRALVSDPGHDIAKDLRRMLKSCEYHALAALSRLDRGWKRPMAWIALASEQIFNAEGLPFIFIRACDVLVRQFQWDRDMVITHVPNRELMFGDLPCGRLIGSEGLSLPLFDAVTIERAISIRHECDAQALAMTTEKEKMRWGWY